MAEHITNEQFSQTVRALIEEDFEKVEGVYLDRGTSLFETLDKITAEQASRPLFDGGTTIAGHVYHTRFYLQVTLDYLEGRLKSKVDWRESWIITARNHSEWNELRGQLKDEYKTVLDYLAGINDWTRERMFGAMGIMAHTAYHLGAIRQMATLVAKES